MSILNRINTMSTVNWWMLACGILAVVCGIFFGRITVKTEKIAPFIISMFLAICLVSGGITVGVMSGQPECQIPTGKVQIEAVFPKGKPGANILDKYNVIEQRGRIWVLEEK